MGIKIWNPKTNKFEKKTSLKASEITVADTGGLFPEVNPKTVEKCLEKNIKEISDMKKDIKYIYENGSIGGGGGGGGGAFPKLELATAPEVIIKTENKFTIAYFFNSPNPGDGNANYVLTKKGSLDPPLVDVRKTIKQGRNGYTFDPIPSGEYELTISATDNQGIGSNIITVKIICGALELSTNEELSRDVSLSQDVTVTYKLVSIFPNDVDLEITYPDGRIVTEAKKPGTYTINLGKMASLGVKSLSLKATHGVITSNILKFNFIVTDTSNMYMSTTFEGGEFRNDATININYRISLLGARQFLTDVYINDVLHEANIESKIGHNFYALNGLALGTYSVKFKSRTLETVNPVRAELTVPNFTVIPAVGRTYQFSKDSLLISLDARKGKSNNQEESKKIKWEDTEPGKPTITTLHNFAFNHLNGWAPKSEEDLTVEALKFSGKAYAEINLSPLNSALTNGLTFEIRYKSKDTGNLTPGLYNFVLDCFRGEKVSGKGIMIDVKEAFARTSYADSIVSEYDSGEWTTHTFVINKAQNEMVLYTNGALSSFAKIDPASDMLIDKKIILGARRNESGQIIDNANCEIQTLRIYNRVLTDEEVFKNFVSDLPVEVQDLTIDLHEGQTQIPTLKLKFDEGALGNASATTPVDIEYSDPSDPSKSLILYNCIIKKQGTTSLTYPVSNYTLNLYDGGIPYDFAPKNDWVPENIFTIKADYMDSSHANNTGIAAYAQEVFKRLGVKNPAQKIDERVKNTIDGFMVNLHINGIPRGLYNFNTDRYGAKNYGLSSTKYKTTALSYEANANTGMATGFHTTDWDKIKGAFKVRYFKGETDSSKYLTYDPVTQEMVMTQGVHKEFENLIIWINKAGNDQNNLFYSELKEYLDVDHTLIYMLIVEIFGLMDNLEKNMVLTYFGEEFNSSTGMVDKIWYPQLYDLDSSVGLSNNGELKYQPCVNFTQEPGMPADHQYNGTGSLLWKNVKKHFFKELKEMYARLRRIGLLNTDSLLSYYQGRTIDKVSPYLYSFDSRLKYITPSGDGTGKDTYYHFCKGRRIEFTRKWLRNRITFLDSVYEYGNENNPDGDYWKYIQARYLKRDNVDTKFIVRVKTTSPVFITTVDDSMQTQGKKHFVSNDKFYNIEVPMNNATDGAMFGMTFGPRVMDLIFPDTIRLTSLYLEHGKSLIELNIPNNRDLSSIVLNNCDNLQKFNVSGSTKLGSVAGNEKIKFDNCPNIREINISNTSLSGFTVNPKGGIIDTLNCNNTNIETFIIKNQPYISTLSMENCNNMKKFGVENCVGVTNIDLPRSVIETFRVLDCQNITEINISNTPYLNSLVDQTDPEKRSNFLIDNCPKLTKLVMSGLNNTNMTWLDLINIENLTYLDISRCGYLSEIRFSQGANKLLNFICHNSNIKNFKLGRNGTTVNYLDLGIFPNLSNVNFDNCQNLLEIKNSNLGRQTPLNANATFRNCKNLTRINGYLRLNGGASQTFYNCHKLVHVGDTIDFSGITTMSETFVNCNLITLNEAKRITNALTGVNGSTWRAFGNCIGIITNESTPFPENFFANNSKMTNFDNYFSGCTNIRGPFPNTLYNHMPNLNYIRTPFNGCNLEVPIYQQDLIFQSLTKLVTLAGPFHGMTFLRMPDKRLLDKCILLENIDSLFDGKTTMSKSPTAGQYFIDEDYFVNNPKLRFIYHAFKNCQGLVGKIPPRLFATQTRIERAEYLFYNCKGINGTIPENFFPTTTVGNTLTSNLTHVHYMFAEVSELEGLIPRSLFEFHTKLIDMSYCFKNCVNLGTNTTELTPNIPKSIFRNKRNLSTVEGFFQNCHRLRIDFEQSNIDDINFFIDNINLTNISYLFDNCQGFVGTLPGNLFNKKDSNNDYIPSKISRADGVFRNCRNLAGRIPKDLFKCFFDILSLNYFFENCFSLEGGIPAELFYNCIKLTSLNGFLRMSWDGTPRKFGTNRDNNEDLCIDETTGFSYAFHKDLFMFCTKLEDITHFLYSIGGQFTGKIHEESFSNLPNLKFLGGTFTNSGVTVDINRVLFGRNSKITNLEYTFRSVRGATITPDAIRGDYHNYDHRDSSGKLIPKNFGGTFANSSMTGTAPNLWTLYPNAISTAGGVNCFTGTNIDNLSDAPLNWK